MKKNHLQQNELRIGNYVYSESAASNIIIEDGGDIDNYELLQPIPLTEDFVVEVLGFSRYNSMFDAPVTTKAGGYQKLRLRHTNWDDKWHKKTWFVVKPANNTIRIQYVHQLQNLFFALTGEELQVKELAL